MEIGHNFSANSWSDFNCLLHIKFGNNVLLSKNIKILDTDFHKILDLKTKGPINDNSEIIIGNNVWIGLNTIILKGTYIADDIIIGAGSLLNGKYLIQHSIYAGIPA